MGFAERVMDQATLVEKRRFVRLNIYFAVVALLPYLSRQMWSLARRDFFSVSEFPLGSMIAEVYRALMSSPATYALVGGGIILALFIVGLPRWRTTQFQSISHQKA